MKKIFESFKEYINEDFKYNSKKEELFKNHFSKNRQEIENRQWKEGEEVFVKHRTWAEPREMEVVLKGSKVFFEAKPISLEMKYGFGDYDFVIPMDELPKAERAKREKGLTKRDYQKMVKDMVSGHEDSDRSIIYDLAENLFNSIEFWKLAEYMEKHENIHGGYKGFGSQQHQNDIIERIVDDMEMYTI